VRKKNKRSGERGVNDEGKGNSGQMAGVIEREGKGNNNSE
jgi:hypothetical protein